MESYFEYLLSLDDEELDPLRFGGEEDETIEEFRQGLEAFRCLDCSMMTENEYYMVHDEIWHSVAGEGMLCIGCLENRLGRRLSKDDFTDAPVNDLSCERSERMKSRLQS